MQIHIQHEGRQTGPFSPEQVRAGLTNGTYKPSDLAWLEGMPEWLPLSAIPEISAAGVPAAPQTSSLAVWSLVLGILALIGAGLTSIPAIICGHLGLSGIKKSGGARSGRGLAIAGLVTGYLGMGVFLIAVLAGLTAPLIIRSKKKADQVEAISNARQIGLALFEFETQYGSFPNDSTAAAVAGGTETEAETGTSSNALFRQLIRSDLASNEQQFYARTSGSRKPDGLTEGSQALEKGECGFAYVSNIEIDGDDPKRPVVMTPFVPGTSRFDAGPFAGKAVILWTDLSVTSLPIDRESGEALFEGRSLLDPDHPVWGGNPPVMALPE